MTASHCPATLELTLGPISAVDLALYAAASGDLNPLQLDGDIARAAGFERPIAHGMRTMACVARMFTQHFGATALRALNTRFVGTAALGDVLVMRATLVQVDGINASYELVVQTAGGAPVVSGNARIAVSVAVAE